MFVSPPGYQPIYSPVKHTYLGPIYGGLREGMSIYIQGTIPKHITRFFINLICGEYESSDIALHFNPRFDGWDKVVFNTCQNGSWGLEEKIHRMPFRKGEHFEMVIIVNFQGYQIKVNGIDFHTFQHRIPMEQVRGLQIADISHFVFKPVPYSNIIPGGMFPKRTIIIRGMVPYGAHKCVILRLLAKSLVQEGIVVRNSMIGGNWGQEEREMTFKSFPLSLRCQSVVETRGLRCL
uniref:Galectin n=1 Tax=Maylandia zebra TaxID=106582 RepID=A0A3P9DDD7_9CICH